MEGHGTGEVSQTLVGARGRGRKHKQKATRQREREKATGGRYRHAAGGRQAREGRFCSLHSTGERGRERQKRPAPQR